jgi:hypothetical protein
LEATHQKTKHYYEEEITRLKKEIEARVGPSHPLTSGGSGLPSVPPPFLGPSSSSGTGIFSSLMGGSGTGNNYCSLNHLLFFFLFYRGFCLIFKCFLDAKRPRSDDMAAGQPPMKKTPGLAAPTLPSQARASPDSYRPVSL